MKTTKNIKDLRSKLLLRVHNVGAGGVNIYGATNTEPFQSKRVSQEIRRSSNYAGDDRAWVLI